MLVLVAGGGCANRSDPVASAPTTSRLTGLDSAIAALTAARTALLADVDAVQRGATAIDDTDAACAAGRGVAARTQRREATPVVQKGRAAVAALGRDVAAYTEALRRLTTLLGTAGATATDPTRSGAATPAADLVEALSAPQRQALERVADDGLAEAQAMSGFRAGAGGAWPAYERLLGIEDTWITRAVTPWYRTAEEGANAYAVLVEPVRPAVDRARTSLARAAAEVQAPSAAQSATLAAADAALAALRTG